MRIERDLSLLGLLHHDINCAPVWDAAKRKYVVRIALHHFGIHCAWLHQRTRNVIGYVNGNGFHRYFDVVVFSR